MKEIVIAQLKRQEGLRLKPYRCSAGKLTIGYGRNLEDNGISREEAEEMLANDVDAAERAVRGRYSWFEKLNKERQAVIINMVFNLGIDGFDKFRKTIGYIERGDFENAGEEMLTSNWAKQVGGRAKELSEIMKKGERDVG